MEKPTWIFSRFNVYKRKINSQLKPYYMKRGLELTAFILSVLIISSCAAEKIRFASNKATDCKTPDVRLHVKRNLSKHILESKSRKYARNVNRTVWVKNRNSPYGKGFDEKNRLTDIFIYPYHEAENSRSVMNFDPAEDFSFLREQKKPETGRNVDRNKLKSMSDNMMDEGNIPLLNSLPNVNYAYIYSRSSLVSTIDRDTGPVKKNAPAVKAIMDPGRTVPLPKMSVPGRGSNVILLITLTGLAALGLLKVRPGMAANISFWAAMNPWKTRLMFAIIHVGLGTAGILLGKKLADNGIRYSDLWGNLFLTGFLASSLLYPVRYSPVRILKHSYLRQKGFDIALLVSGFMLMVSTGNSNPEITASFTRMVKIHDNEKQNVNSFNNHSRNQKQLLYYQDEIQENEEKSGLQKKDEKQGTKIFYTVLAVLVGLVLACLLAAAACGLSCNGMEGLAFLVAVGGGTLLIWLSVLLIKRIWHPRPGKRIKPSEASDRIPVKGILQT
jgi:hypothetical protein